MARSPEAARIASGRHGFPWRAAGLILVTMFMLAGAGLIAMALNEPEPLYPPQPDPAAAPPFLLTPSPSEPASTPSPAAPGTPSASAPSGEGGGTTSDRTDSGRADAERTPSAGTNRQRSAGTDRQRPSAAPRQRPSAAPSPKPVGMPRSTPVRVKVPRIGIDAEIIPVGLNERRELVVPPLDKPHLTGWYELGPSPGEVGNAVVVGHVDSRSSGPAVFFHLGAMQRGDIIEIVRADGKVARFVVDGVARYPKNDFPTQLVYGPADKPQLRLVTCGGTFNSSTRSYQDNIVVFATLLQ